MILKIRQTSEKKEAIIGAKSARQVPALGDFCVACEKRVNDSGNDSEVCSPIDSGVHAKSVGKTAWRSAHHEVEPATPASRAQQGWLSD
jgi:hypothetical protein